MDAGNRLLWSTAPWRFESTCRVSVCCFLSRRMVTCTGLPWLERSARSQSAEVAIESAADLENHVEGLEAGCGRLALARNLLHHQAAAGTPR